MFVAFLNITILSFFLSIWVLENSARPHEYAPHHYKQPHATVYISEQSDHMPGDILVPFYKHHLDYQISVLKNFCEDKQHSSDASLLKIFNTHLCRQFPK